jgi:hypothetical protein
MGTAERPSFGEDKPRGVDVGCIQKGAKGVASAESLATVGEKNSGWESLIDIA